MTDQPGDSDPDDTAPLAADLTDMIGGAAGAAFGLVIAGPGGAIVGAASGPAVAAALRYGADALHARRQRAGRALQLAADQLHITPDELGAQATQEPARLELLARVLEAAGRTPLEEKIEALGRVLADGLNDDARLDEALLLATALDTIEAPHIQVLRKINGPARGPGAFRNTRGQPVGGISPALPGLRDLLPSLLGTLRGAGLIEDVGYPASEERIQGGGVKRTEPSPRWRATDLGRRCIELLDPA